METVSAPEATASMEATSVEAATMSAAAVAATVTAAPGVGRRWKRDGASRERECRGAGDKHSLEVHIDILPFTVMLP